MVKGYFTDEAGNKSMGRLITFWSALIGTLGGTLCALMAVIRDGDMGSNTAMFFLGLVLGSAGLKIGSKFGEKFKASQTTTH